MLVCCMHCSCHCGTVLTPWQEIGESVWLFAGVAACSVQALGLLGRPLYAAPVRRHVPLLAVHPARLASSSSTACRVNRRACNGCGLQCWGGMCEHNGLGLQQRRMHVCGCSMWGRCDLAWGLLAASW
jgi:hypothetical protein